MARRRYHRLFRLPFTRPDPGEVDDEFRFHLAMRTAELERQGQPPERARAMALAEFGDIEEARRFCRAEDERRMSDQRRSQWWDAVRHDLRFAARALRRQPAFAFSTVFTLGLAIALATTAFGIVHAYLLRPLPYPNADRLVRLMPEASGGPLPDPARFERVDWRVADGVFAATASWNPDGFTVAGPDRTESVRGAWVAPGYFTLLGKRPALGRPFEPGEHVEHGPAAIISDALWSRLFGRDPSVLGRAIRIRSLEEPEGAELVTVVGIMAAGSWHVDPFTDVLRPLPVGARFPMMALLAPGMPAAEAERRLNAAVLPQMGVPDSTFRFAVVGVQEDYTQRIRPTLGALLGGAVFLLLIAGANVAGAQTARAAARRAEIQVRVALGASRGRVALQLLVENLMVAIAAGALGTILGGSVLATLGTAVGERLGAGIPGGGDRLALEPGILLLVAAAGSLLGAIFGLLPAVVLTRAAGGTARAGDALRAARGTARSLATPLVRRGLIAAQVAFTVTLLVGAGLMGRTVLAIATTPLGFEDRGVVKGDLFLPPSRYRGEAAIAPAVDRLLAGMAAAPGAREVAASFPDPLQSFTVSPVGVATAAPSGSREGEPRATTYRVTPGFFELLAIPVKAGRSFGPADVAGAGPVVIVSEGLARVLWPGAEAIGRQLRTSEDSVWRTVVGVAGETRLPAETDPVGELYVPLAQRPIPLFFVLARVAGDPGVAAMGLQRAVSRVDDALGLANVAPLGDLADQATRRQHSLATVLGVFAALALGLAMLGLYASLAYVVAQRRREIAIRVAVGANHWSIRRLVVGEGTILVAVGLGAGLLMSLSLTRLLGSLLYGVTPADPATYAIIATLLGSGGLLASLIPLRQAARVDPVEVLRSE